MDIKQFLPFVFFKRYESIWLLYAYGSLVVDYEFYWMNFMF